MKWQPAPVFLPGESHGQGSLAGYRPWGHKESDTAAHSTAHDIYQGRFRSTNTSFDSKISMRNSRRSSWPLYLHKFE